MLRTLRIRNFAIVDAIEFDAAPGLTVFTGETGAGKTIIVEAIRFLLGGRGSSDLIRTGADSAAVEGLFVDLPSTVRDELGDSPADSIWLRRELTRGGSTRCFIDDRQVTRTILQKIGAQLADLCGQHQQQQLLDPARHIDLLDEAAGADDQVAQVRRLYDELVASRRELQTLRVEIARLREQEELRRFQIAEIRAAAIEPDEDDRLKTEIEILRNARRLSETADRALAVLSDEDDAVSVALGRLLREADRLAAIDPRWTAIGGQLTGARDTIDDLVRSFTEYCQSLEFDPARAEQIEARQAELFRLKQKYGGSCAAVHGRLRELEAEQTSAGDREQRAARLAREEGEREISLSTAAQQLSAARQSAAARLAKAVNGALAGLGMTGARVRVDVTPRTDGGITVKTDDGPIHVHENGADEVQFTFEANPKEGFKPLHKIASGGELSRLLLAFKNAMPARSQSRLYIFDEVDSGIGGRTAALVAERIAELARRSQVFLISHLQQMAAPADQHCLIEKQTERGRARVTLRRLEGDERVRELARMVAGDEVTERTLEFASELAGGNSLPRRTRRRRTNE